MRSHLHDFQVCIVPYKYEAETEDAGRAEQGARCRRGELGEDRIGGDEEDEIVDTQLHLSASPKVVDEDKLAW